jgi:hypothetical protein
LRQERHLRDRDARRGDRDQRLGDGKEVVARTAGGKPAGDRLAVEPSRVVGVLGMRRIDAAADGVELGLEGAEEREVVPLERRLRVRAPRFGAPRGDAQLAREPEECRVRVVGDLAAGVEGDVAREREPPDAPSDTPASLENGDVGAAGEETVGSCQAGKPRSDDDDAGSGDQTGTSPSRRP